MKFLFFCLVPVLTSITAAYPSAVDILESDLKNRDSLRARSVTVFARDSFKRLDKDRPILHIRGNTPSHAVPQTPSDFSQRPHERLSQPWSLELGKVSGTDFPSLRIKTSPKVPSRPPSSSSVKSGSDQSRGGARKSAEAPSPGLWRSQSAPELALKMPTIPESRPGHAPPRAQSPRAKSLMASKKAIPLYIGCGLGVGGLVTAATLSGIPGSGLPALTTGVCGGICLAGSGIATAAMYGSRQAKARARAKSHAEALAQAPQKRPGQPQTPARTPRFDSVLLRRAAPGKEDEALRRKRAACGCPSPAKRRA